MEYEQLQLIVDAVQSVALLVVCGVLIYFVIRLEQNVRAAAKLIDVILNGQKDIRKRLDAIETERFTDGGGR